MPKADNARKRRSAAAALEPLWHRQASELRAGEADLRLESPRSAQRLHTAAGRLRNALSAFRPLLADDAVEGLTDDLKWVAQPVGAARDAVGMRGRLLSLSDLEPDGPDISRARDSLVKVLDVSYRESWQRCIDSLDSARYDTLIRALDRFTDAPPWRSAARGRADHVLLPLLRDEWTRFRKKAGKALAHDAGLPQSDRLREAGNAAARAQGVCVALVPTFGRKVKQMGRGAERVAAVLDEQRDVALTQRLLTDAGEQAVSDGDGGFALKRMQALETRNALELHQEFVRQFGEADRKSLRRWLH
jgi:inorganic triphosphatase YgiF